MKNPVVVAQGKEGDQVGMGDGRWEPCRTPGVVGQMEFAHQQAQKAQFEIGLDCRIPQDTKNLQMMTFVRNESPTYNDTTDVERWAVMYLNRNMNSLYTTMAISKYLAI